MLPRLSSTLFPPFDLLETSLLLQCLYLKSMSAVRCFLVLMNVPSSTIYTNLTESPSGMYALATAASLLSMSWSSSPVFLFGKVVGMTLGTGWYGLHNMKI